MSERRSRWWGRRLEDLPPELFWLVLVVSWLLVGLCLWSYARWGNAPSLVPAAFALLMGLRSLWALRRRRMERQR